jgi:glutaminase
MYLPLHPVPETGGRRYVSTGALPSHARVGALVQRAHELSRSNPDGELSTVYPVLAQADPSRFGIALTEGDGVVHEAGDARVPFTLMSVSKPFVFALVCDEVGIAAARSLVGVNATGLPFNSAHAVDRAADGRTNPMVNAGAIAATSLVPGADLERRWAWLADGLARFAGRPLDLDEATLASARATNFRNRALAMLLRGADALVGDPESAVELYTRQCCLQATSVDLATMGATLADGGLNPVTGERVVTAAAARATLAVMSIAGMYEASGDWLLDVGYPGKSGISGGIVAVSPGKGALGLFSPLLDGDGNSVRGQLAARFLAAELGLDLLAAEAPHDLES